MARLTVALLATAFVPFVQADTCCDALSATSLKTRLLFPGQDAYEARKSSYFDVKQQSITANCFAQPKNAKEVALVVKTLANKQCKFAIRSAGHTPYAGASNIEDGVTLDLKHLDAVKYDAKSEVVNVGPAAIWNDVFSVLEPLGRMMPGGRSSTVGVGGFTLGGGISYFSPEHGLACDHVVEFEVVLASGEIVTASKNSHPDLFTVLKGGNNNFGVVTSFKFDTFEYNGMWGGLVTYPASTIQDHFKALINFSNGIDKSPKAGVIVMPVYMSSIGTDLILNAYDYTEPVSRPAAFDEFFAVRGNVSDTTGVTNMSTLASTLKGATTHSVYFGTLTFANDLRVMTKAHEIYMDVLSNLKAKATGDWQIYALYQPFAPAYWRQSAAKGGNVLGLERFGDEVLCLYQPYLSWQGAVQDELFQSAGADLINRIREYAESIGADNPYLYLNYADKTQDPLTSYGNDSMKKMKAAAKKYDPSGVFQKLVPGGFKISTSSLTPLPTTEAPVFLLQNRQELLQCTA